MIKNYKLIQTSKKFDEIIFLLIDNIFRECMIYLIKKNKLRHPHQLMVKKYLKNSVIELKLIT